MKISQLQTWLKASPKIFIWARLSESYAAYFQINKITLNEYLLKQTLEEDEDLYIEFGDDGELYIGRTDSEDS